MRARAVWCIMLFLLLSNAAARAIEAGVERAWLNALPARDEDGNIIIPDTHDGDENGIADRAHLRLLDSVLRDPAAPRHTLLLSIWTLNHLQIIRDNTLVAQCPLLPILLGFTCDDIQRLTAALFTIGEEKSVTDAIERAAEYRITLNRANYNTSGNVYLGAAGDLDGDGFTNKQEWDAVCGDYGAYIAAAMDANINPRTLPCCKDCPLRITRQPQDGERYAGDSYTFSVAVDNTEGPVRYQWFKDGAPIGPNAPELALTFLQPGDSGGYHCDISDATETVVTRTAQLTVARRMQITRQPEGATRFAGESHTFEVTVTGGLGTLRYQWLHNGSPIGGDAPRLQMPVLMLEDAGLYACAIDDNVERVESQAAPLFVEPIVEGEGATEGEGVPEGEGEPDGEGAPEGEGQQEGEGAPEGEGQPEGEGALEGEGQPEGEGAPEGEGQQEGEGAPEGEGQPEGEGASEGEGQPEGEGAPEGEPEGEGEPGILQVSPALGGVLDFGPVRIGAAALRAVEVRNTGGVPLAGAASLVDGAAMSLPTTVFEIAPAASTLVHVAFSPQTRAVHTDVLILESGDQRILLPILGDGVYLPFLHCGGAPGGVPRAPAAGDGAVLLFAAGTLLLAGFRRG